jgi:hypothetical protein
MDDDQVRGAKEQKGEITLTDQESDDDTEFGIIFKHEALKKLQELGAWLGIPKDRLGDVLVKGLHIIDLAKDGKLIIEKPKQRLEVDLKEL